MNEAEAVAHTGTLAVSGGYVIEAEAVSHTGTFSFGRLGDRSRVWLNLSAASLEGAVLSVRMGLWGCGSVEVPNPEKKNERSMPISVSQM